MFLAYFWNIETLTLFSLKVGGELRELKITKPCKYNKLKEPAYRISVCGHRRNLFLSDLKKLKLENSVIPVKGNFRKSTEATGWPPHTNRINWTQLKPNTYVAIITANGGYGYELIWDSKDPENISWAAVAYLPSGELTYGSSGCDSFESAIRDRGLWSQPPKGRMY